MAYETKENSGSLFKNERKLQPNHADYQGKVKINGVDMYINAWVKKSKDGSKSFFSLTF